MTDAPARTPWQQIDCEVTFLRDRGPGVPKPLWPKTLNGGVYRPHFVVDGEYLGVMFDVGPANFEYDIPMAVTVTLLFWPHASYEKLNSGTTFTVREGPYTLGHGKVLRWHELKEWPG